MFLMQTSSKARNSLMKIFGIKGTHSSVRSSVLSESRALTLGRLPEVFFGGSLGLLLVALAFSNALAETAWVYLFYWLGLLLLILPVAFRLFSKAVSRHERISLLVFLGLGFYLVKVMHSPFMFTYSDEFLHFRNADNILQSRALFGVNSILPVSAYYPGLEIITTAVAFISGLNIFSSGLLVIGVARLIIILSLFLLFEQVSGSSRIAGLAVLLYTANSNFLYWSAQFSYESLSLPLGILVLFALAKRGRTSDQHIKRGLTLVMLLLITAIIITHHVTSYALVFFFFVLSIVYSLLQFSRKRKYPNTWGLTMITAGFILSWLLFVAFPTKNYLYQIFKHAFTSVFQLFTGEDTGRALFTSATGTVAPVWERLVGISSVLLTILGIPAGLIAIWIRKRLNPFTIVLACAASLYFVTLGLRFTGAGWEIANRTSEFLFIGIAFLIAFGFAILRLKFPKKRSLSFVFGGYAAILFMGGVIAGWPPPLRLSQPLLIAVNGATLRPPGLNASDWILAMHGPDNDVVAPPSDALLLLAYGRQQALTGKIYSIQDLLTNQHTLEWQTKILQKVQVHYLVMDRRQISWDGMLGLYFTPFTASPTTRPDLFPPEIFTMFDGQAQIPRIFDNGSIVIYDVGVLSGDTQTK
jgi:hypothetical protein